MDSLGRAAALLIAVILLFLFPLRYDAAAKEQTAHSYQQMEMEHFWHDISTQRKLTVNRYQQFCEALGKADFTGTITIECYRPMVYENESEYATTQYNYEDLIQSLAGKDEIVLNQGEYITIYLRKNKDTLVDKLLNLVVPFYLYSEESQMGGRIN